MNHKYNINESLFLIYNDTSIYYLKFDLINQILNNKLRMNILFILFIIFIMYLFMFLVIYYNTNQINKILINKKK